MTGACRGAADGALHPTRAAPLPRVTKVDSVVVATEKHRDTTPRVVRHGMVIAGRWTAGGALRPGGAIPSPRVAEASVRVDAPEHYGGVSLRVVRHADRK